MTNLISPYFKSQTSETPSSDITGNPDTFGSGNISVWMSSPMYPIFSQDTSACKPRISPNGSTSSFCRICHDGDGTETLVSPCNCTGTLAQIHISCLEQWLTSSSTDKCEICKHQFKIIREPRTYAEYIHDTGNQFNVRNMIADIFCFFLLTPLLVVSTYLCGLGAQQYFIRERWEAIGLVILAFFLLSVYYTWCHVTLRYHLSVWSQWQNSNQRVRLVDVNHQSFAETLRTGNDVLEPTTSSNQHPTETPIGCHECRINIIPAKEDDEDEHGDVNQSDTSRIIIV